MGFRASVVQALRSFNHKYGISVWLKGEPRPPLGGFDLDGEKLIDWGWVCVNLPHGTRRALEIGPGESPIVPAMLALGYDVTAVDPWVDVSNKVGGFSFISGDFLDVKFQVGFDLIVLCSVVEHVGISGRYNSRDMVDADLGVMDKVRSLLINEGLVFLTVPVGQDAVHKPWHRVYGQSRLPRLLQGFEVVRSRFLVKKPGGPWEVATQATALAQPVDVRRYALGEFVLRKEEPRLRRG